VPLFFAVHLLKSHCAFSQLHIFMLFCLGIPPKAPIPAATSVHMEGRGAYLQRVGSCPLKPPFLHTTALRSKPMSTRPTPRVLSKEPAAPSAMQLKSLFYASYRTFIGPLCRSVLLNLDLGIIPLPNTN